MEPPCTKHPSLLAKAGGNYLNSQLIKMEALTDDYAEGIALDVNGYVSEAAARTFSLSATMSSTRPCRPVYTSRIHPRSRHAHCPGTWL